MRIAITTNQPLSFWYDMGKRPLGAGGQIQAHYLAHHLSLLGYEVDFPQSKGGRKHGKVKYINYDEAKAKKYDVVIGYCVPEVAFWVDADRRFVSVQNDNHWLPVEPEIWDGIDKVVLVGECLYKHYAKYMDESRLWLIGNGYDPNRCYPDDSKRNPRSICFSAAPTHSSGLHIALRALKLIDRDDIEFHIYGSLTLWGCDTKGNTFTPDDDYERLLWDLILTLRRETGCSVYIHGALPYWKMLPEYTKHAIMIHPKTHETFGCSLVEAIASGVVPVVSNVNACLDRVKHGVTGFNCQYDDPADFAEKVSLLLDDEELWHSMSLRCREYAKQYTFKEIAKQWAKLVEQ